MPLEHIHRSHGQHVLDEARVDGANLGETVEEMYRRSVPILEGAYAARFKMLSRWCDLWTSSPRTWMPGFIDSPAPLLTPEGQALPTANLEPGRPVAKHDGSVGTVLKHSLQEFANFDQVTISNEMSGAGHYLVDSLEEIVLANLLERSWDPAQVEATAFSLESLTSALEKLQDQQTAQGGRFPLVAPCVVLPVSAQPLVSNLRIRDAEMLNFAWSHVLPVDKWLVIGGRRSVSLTASDSPFVEPTSTATSKAQVEVRIYAPCAAEPDVVTAADGETPLNAILGGA